MIVAHASRRVVVTDGGPTRTTLDLLDVMRERGHETRLISSMPRDVPGRWLSGDGPSITTFPTRGGAWGLATRAGVVRIRKALEGADILHLQVPWDPLNYQLSRIAYSMGVPYCVSLRGTLDDWAMSQKPLKKRVYLTMFARRLLEQAAFVHCTAAAEAAQSRKWFPRGRVRVIPNFLDLRAFQSSTVEEPAPVSGIDPRDRVVLFLSRIFPGKGLEVLIDALPQLAQEHPDVKLVIAGSGSVDYIEELRRQCHGAGIADRVLFSGFIQGDEKASLFKRASVFVLISAHENFGNVLFEAAAAGTPIVLSRQVATWQELTDGAGAIPADPTPESVAKAISAHLAMPHDEAAMFRKRSASWTAGFLDRQKISGMYETAYRGG
jgi:glycosyltransferase involved in cell wall biosynthesis